MIILYIDELKKFIKFHGKDIYLNKYITENIKVTPENNIQGEEQEQEKNKKIYELNNILKPTLNINY